MDILLILLSRRGAGHLNIVHLGHKSSSLANNYLLEELNLKCIKCLAQGAFSVETLNECIINILA